MPDDMTITEVLETLKACTGPTQRLLVLFPKVVQAVEHLASLDNAMVERGRALRALEQQMTDANAAALARAAECQAQHEASAAERRVEMQSLDRQVSAKRHELVELEGALSEARAVIEQAKHLKEEHVQMLRKLVG